jgi:hypothetical protein
MVGAHFQAKCSSGSNTLANHEGIVSRFRFNVQTLDNPFRGRAQIYIRKGLLPEKKVNLDMYEYSHGFSGFAPASFQWVT